VIVIYEKPPFVDLQLRFIMILFFSKRVEEGIKSSGKNSEAWGIPQLSHYENWKQKSL